MCVTCRYVSKCARTDLPHAQWYTKDHPVSRSEHRNGIQDGPWYATNGMSLSSGKQRKPSTVSSLAAPAGLRDIHKVIRFTLAVSSYVFLRVCFNLIV